MKRTRLRPMSKKRRQANVLKTAIRQAVFARDGYQCQLARVSPVVGDCFGPLTPHHLLKASAGGEYVVDNLTTLCAHHNGWVEDHPRVATELGMVRR